MQIVPYFSFMSSPRGLQEAVSSPPRDGKSNGGHRTQVHHPAAKVFAVESGK